MKSRRFFRENGLPVCTHARFDGWWCVVALLLVTLAYALASVRDIRAGLFPPPAPTPAHAPHTALASLAEPGDADAFEQGLERGTAHAIKVLLPQVQRAYEQGLNDGVRATAGQPEGVALAQACLAMQVAQTTQAPRGRP